VSGSKSQTSKELLFFECLFLFCIGLCFFAVFFFIAESNYNELFNDLPKPNKEASSGQASKTDSHVSLSALEKITHPQSSDKTQQAIADNESLDPSELARQKRDVTAQEGMWRAANHLVVLTLFQILVGILTIGFLVWTLYLQRGELQEARKVTKSQRAYMSLIGAAINTLGADRVIISMSFQNFGQTPATDVFGNVGGRAGKGVVIVNTHRQKKGSLCAPTQQFRAHPIVVQEADFVEDFKSGDKKIYLAVELSYRTIFDEPDTLTVTGEYYLSSRDALGNTNYSFSECPVEIAYEDKGEQITDISVST